MDSTDGTVDTGASRSLVMAILVTGAVMVALDTTIVSVALHEIGASLGSEDNIEWAATAYLLAVCAAQPVTGWLADRYGRRRMYLTALSIFTVTSLGCAVSNGLPMLIFFRAAQGLGGGAIAPIGMALVLDLYPGARRGGAMAIWTIAIMIAPAIGPTVGGVIITYLSWHWMFLVNLPFGIAAVTLGIRMIPDVGHRQHRLFDLPGLVLGSGGLTMAVLGLAQGNSWGWSSWATLGSLGVGVVALALFARRELRFDHPMIELKLLGVGPFRLSIGVLLFVTLAQFGRVVFIPLQLEGLRGFSPIKVGFLLFAPAIGSMATTMIGGRLADRLGPRRPVVIGCCIVLVALVMMARLQLDTSLAWLEFALVVQSVGLGLVIAPSLMAGLGEMPASLMAHATALRSLAGQVSGALAIALMGAIVATRSGADPTPAHAQAAYNAGFAAAAIGVALGIVMALRLPAVVASRHGGPDESPASSVALVME